MKMDLELPSKAVVEVELDYEKLDKHCFLCKSLSHEKDDCPLKQDARYKESEQAELGISQRNTLERIAEGRKRQENRRYARFTANSHQHQGARWTNTRYDNHRQSSNSSLDRDDRLTRRSSEVEENRRRYDDRYLEGRRSVSRRPPSHTSRERDSLRASHDSSLPHDTHLRKHYPSLSKEATSRSHHSPPEARQNPKSPNFAQRTTDPSSDHGTKRNSALDRLSLPHSDGNKSAKERLSIAPIEERLPAHERLSVAINSEERLPASERLSVQTQRIRREEEDNNSAPSDTENQTILLPSQCVVNNATITRPSSSAYFDSNRLGPCDRSPIRTLSEDRVHVSLRLGPLFSEEEVADDEGAEDTPQLILNTSLTAPSKAAGKHAVDSTQARKRTNNTTDQGAELKKRRVTKNSHHVETPPELKQSC
ncbi:Zinc knuckle CX2CX4HX4C protein [Raphanus sativus]|nr:Zinc knuckle CX2CX4HX4C protein [Raphanus sativus]